MVLSSRAYFQSMNMQQTYKIVLFNISLITASEVLIVMQKYKFNRNSLNSIVNQEERIPKYWHERKVYYLDCKDLNIISSTSTSLIDII